MDKRGEDIDEVNRAVKPLQKGAASPTMIAKYFMLREYVNLVKDLDLDLDLMYALLPQRYQKDLFKKIRSNILSLWQMLNSAILLANECRTQCQKTSEKRCGSLDRCRQVREEMELSLSLRREHIIVLL